MDVDVDGWDAHPKVTIGLSSTAGTGLLDSVYLDTEPEAVLEVGTGCAVAVEVHPAPRCG